MKLPLPPARSLGNKLALVFFAVIAVAFSVIFFFVVPQLLESRLIGHEPRNHLIVLQSLGKISQYCLLRQIHEAFVNS